MSIPRRLCTKISERSNTWTDSDRYQEHPKKTVRVYRGRNYRGRDLPRPYPYAGEYPAQIQCITVYGISQREKFADDIWPTCESEVQVRKPAVLVQRLCVIYSSSVYVQDYLFPLSFVFQTWIFLLCYFSCGRQTCFDCSMGGLSFPSHRLSLFYSTGIARGCLFSTKQKPPPFGGGFLCAALLIYNASGYIKRSWKGLIHGGCL